MRAAAAAASSIGHSGAGANSLQGTATGLEQLADEVMN
jgi:hypothetical protein